MSNFPLTKANVLTAYAKGMFPMAESAASEGVFWVEPIFRGILPLDHLHISRKLAKSIKANDYEIKIDHDFDAVIANCATRKKGDKDTWINPLIKQVYGDLFKSGDVHTVEVYRENRLIGGLYGLAIGGAFFGESMFHLETDASKIALTFLVARLKANGFKLLDTQFITPHLTTLGAIEIKQALYLLILQDALKVQTVFNKTHEITALNVLDKVKTII